MGIIAKIKGRLRYERLKCFIKKGKKATMKAIEASSGKRIFLFVNPVHPNLGDQAQTMCALRLFKRFYPDYQVVCIPKQLTTDATIPAVRRVITPDDLVFIHSGYLTTELYGYIPFMCEVVDSFHANKITILPQTINIFTEEMRRMITTSYNAHPDLTLMCRDQKSYEDAQKLFTCRLLLFPDIVTSLIGAPDFEFNNPRSGVLFVIRDDKEKLYSDNEIARLQESIRALGQSVDRLDTTIRVSPFVWLTMRDGLIKKYIERFSRYRLVVTDRYHGTIFAQIASTPTIVISSTDHKLQSGVKWFPTDIFGKRLFYALSLDDAAKTAADVLKSDNSYNPAPPYFYDKYWSHLGNLDSFNG